MKKVFFFISLFVTLASQMSYAVFNNSGVMRSKSSNLAADILSNTGTIEGLDYVHLQCNQLTGNGLIKGPNMEILAVECDYEGVIDCSQECILKTNTPSSKFKFRFIGGGKLVLKKANN